MTLKINTRCNTENQKPKTENLLQGPGRGAGQRRAGQLRDRSGGPPGVRFGHVSCQLRPAHPHPGVAGLSGPGCVLPGNLHPGGRSSLPGGDRRLQPHGPLSGRAHRGGGTAGHPLHLRAVPQHQSFGRGGGLGRSPWGPRRCLSGPMCWTTPATPTAGRSISRPSTASSPWAPGPKPIFASTPP